MPRPATGWSGPTRPWGQRPTGDSKILFPTPGELTNCVPKASPFAGILTTRSKSIGRPCSCARMRQNFTKHLENSTSIITLTDAQRELEKAVELDPSRTKALYLLGRLYVLNQENEKAVPYLQRALRLQPNLNEASGLLGTAYVRMGQFADAIPRLEKAAPLDHYGNVHYQLYLAYRKLGQTELAQKALARSQDLRRSSLERDQALIMGSPQVEPEPQ